MNLKKIISCFLSVILAFSFPISVLAFEISESHKVLLENEYNNYAKEVIVGYLASNGINMSSEINISQPFSIHNDNDENNRSFFVFSDGKCVGQLIVTHLNNEFYSSFTRDNLLEIDNALQNNIQFNLIVQEDCQFFVSNKDIICISGNNSISQTRSLMNCSDSYPKNSINLSEVNVNIEELDARSTNNSCILDVICVSNAISPDTNKGLCWAASLASLIAYRLDAPPLTALGLYNLLKENFTSTEYPIGSCLWTTRAFSLFNLTYTHLHSGANYDTVVTTINQNRPIYCWLTKSSESGAHSVLICGYASAYGYYQYVLMDPNEDIYVNVDVTSLTSTTFVYPSNTGTYDGWYCRMY